MSDLSQSRSGSSSSAKKERRKSVRHKPSDLPADIIGESTGSPSRASSKSSRSSKSHSSKSGESSRLRSSTSSSKKSSSSSKHSSSKKSSRRSTLTSSAASPSGTLPESSSPQPTIINADIVAEIVYPPSSLPSSGLSHPEVPPSSIVLVEAHSNPTDHSSSTKPPVIAEVAPATLPVIDETALPVTTSKRSSVADVPKAQPPKSSDAAPAVKKSNAPTHSDKPVDWVDVQKHTFTAWLNYQLRDVVPPQRINNLFTDLSSGVILVHLMKKLIPESAAIKTATNPRMRVQYVENISTVLKVFREKAGLKLVNIGAEDVCDGNRNIILGLIWSIILKFQVSNAIAMMPPPDVSSSSSSSSEEDDFGLDLGVESGEDEPVEVSSGPSASSSSSPHPSSTTSPASSSSQPALASAHSSSDPKANPTSPRPQPTVTPPAGPSKPSGQDPSLSEIKNSMIAWVEKRVAPFGVHVENLSSAFSDGRAFAALTASVDASFDFFQLESEDPFVRLDQSFDFNEEKLGIPKLLSAEHLCPPYTPDEKSILTYVSLIYQQFSGKKAIKPSQRPSYPVIYGSDDEPPPEATAAGPKQAVDDDAPTEINIEFSGTGHIQPYAFTENEIIVSIGDKSKLEDILSFTESLTVSELTPSGAHFDFQKSSLPSGETKFVFTPSAPVDTTLVLKFEGDEIAVFPISVKAPLKIEWDQWSDSIFTPINSPCILRCSIFSTKNGRAFTPQEYQEVNVSVAGPSTIPAHHVVKDGPYPLEISFTPTARGEYDVRVSHEGILTYPTCNVLSVIYTQRVFTGVPATFPLCNLPDEMASLSENASLTLRSPDGTCLNIPIDRLSLTFLAPLCFQYAPSIEGVYSVFLCDGDVGTHLPPFVAISPPENAQIPAGPVRPGTEVSFEIPWLTNFNDPKLSIISPNGVEVEGTPDQPPVEIITKDGHRWIRGVWRPEIEGEYRLVALDPTGTVQSLLTVQVEAPAKPKAGKLDTKKAVEVISVLPVEKADKGVVRVYLADDEIPTLLGIKNTFKTTPITSTTTYAQMRETVIRRICQGIEDKTKRKVQALIKQDQYCIVFVKRDGDESIAPFAGNVLNDITRFKKETAQRLQREAIALMKNPEEEASSSSETRGRSDSRANHPSNTPGSRSSMLFGGTSSSSGHPKPSASSSTKGMHSSRQALLQQREEERAASAELMKKIESGVGWNKTAGSFKLVVRVHSSENLLTLPISKMGALFVEVSHDTQHFKSSPWDPITKGEPVWETSFNLSVKPGPKKMLHVFLRHTKAEPDALPIGLIDIPLNYLQPDMAKKAYYVIRKPGQQSTLSNRRLLITLEHHVLEVESDTRLFLKPAPKLFLEISVKYPVLNCRVGETLTVEATVRDEKKSYALTDDLKGGKLEVHITNAAGDTQVISPPPNESVGQFLFHFVPREPGKYRALLKYSGTTMQRKAAKIDVKPASKAPSKVTLNKKK